MKRILSTVLILLNLSIHSYSQKPAFNHFAIHVVNLEKSADFYKNIIGLDTISNPFNDNKHIWFAIGQGTSLHIIAGANATSQHPQDNHLCFSVRSVTSFIENLTRANIPYQNARGIKNEITIRPDGVKQIYFTDPDGYWIEINDAKN